MIYGYPRFLNMTLQQAEQQITKRNEREQNKKDNAQQLYDLNVSYQDEAARKEQNKKDNAQQLDALNVSYQAAQAAAEQEGESVGRGRWTSARLWS